MWEVSSVYIVDVIVIIDSVSLENCQPLSSSLPA